VTLPNSPPSAEDEAEHALPTSDLLLHIVEACPQGLISIGDLIDGLGDRAFSILFLILTLPTAVPGPPGLPVAFSIPLIVFAAQLVLGYEHPWLPAFIRRRRFSREALLSVLRKVRPTLKWLEHYCRPRILRLTTPRNERWLGVYLFICAMVLINPIPIPFTHLPLGLSLVILSLGYVERDGVIIIAGGIAALGGMAINISLTGGAFVLGLKFLHFL
jgi:hypothetical protein